VSPGVWSEYGERAPVWPGRLEPLGATWGEEATNFAVRAPRATRAWVCLVDDDGTETRHELTERTLGTWHGALPGVARPA
jgi:pullulanase/glycogen debranching enzyme